MESALRLKCATCSAPPCRHVRPDDDDEGDYYDGQGDVDYAINVYGMDWIRMRIIIPTILLKGHLSRNPPSSNACINPPS